MPETLGELNIDIVIDWRKVERSFRKVSATLKKVSKNIDQDVSKAMNSIPREATKAVSKTNLVFAAMGRGIKATTSKMAGSFRVAFAKILRIATRTMIAIGAAMAGFVVFGAKLALDAQEVENLMEVSFGNMEDSANKWINAFADGLGLFKPAVKNYAATLNIMSRAMGLTDKESLKLSENLTKRAFDLASLRNLRIEDAFLKITAALSGESEPLKRLGFIINETTTKTFAYANSIAKQGEELTETQKTMARYGLIMKLTDDAQGDLTKTQHEGINPLRLLNERFKTMTAEVGTVTISSKTFQKTIKGLFKIIERLQPKLIELAEKGFGILDKFISDDDKMRNFAKTMREVSIVALNFSKIMFTVIKFFVGSDLPGKKKGLSGVLVGIEKALRLLLLAGILIFKGKLIVWMAKLIVLFVKAPIAMALASKAGIGFAAAMVVVGNKVGFLTAAGLKFGVLFPTLAKAMGIVKVKLSLLIFKFHSAAIFSKSLSIGLKALKLSLIGVSLAAAALVGWKIGKWAVKNFAWVDAISTKLAELVIWITKAINLIPGINLGGIGTFGDTDSPKTSVGKKIKSTGAGKKIKSTGVKALSSISATTKVASPNAVAKANAGRQMTSIQKAQLNELQKIRRELGAQPAKEKMLNDTY